MPTVEIGGRSLGRGCPIFICAEIGINHNGDLALTKKLIDVASVAGCDAVKFQKRTPEVCVPASQRDVLRDTPWGEMTYLEYRHRVEFGHDEYLEIDKYCREKGILWFASCWDISSVDFIEEFSPPCYKIASATLTDDDLLRHVVSMKRPVILSTGMSTMEEIRSAVAHCSPELLLIVHSTSTYPCPPEEINLKMMHTLEREFGGPIGYSGHEMGLQVSYAAVALGACFLERHIPLDRTSWGSDQAASVELDGMIRLVRDVRMIEAAMGDGVKRVYDSEIAVQSRLRKTTTR